MLVTQYIFLYLAHCVARQFINQEHLFGLFEPGYLIGKAMPLGELEALAKDEDGGQAAQAA